MERFKGSRYVQSLVGNDTYKDVRIFLRSGRLVLFIGTPCQIAGLKTFLRKDYDNLITVDLICHGVCPTKYFKEEVAYLTEKYNLNGVADIRFRGNDGNNFRLTLWNKDRESYSRGTTIEKKYFDLMRLSNTTSRDSFLVFQCVKIATHVTILVQKEFRI